MTIIITDYTNVKNISV